MMTTPISLTVHRNTKEKRERREVWCAAQEKAKSLPKNIDGFAMVYFTRHGVRSTTANVMWFVRDSADTFLLPEMARHEIQRAMSK